MKQLLSQVTNKTGLMHCMLGVASSLSRKQNIEDLVLLAVGGWW